METRTKFEIIGGVVLVVAIAWGSYSYQNKQVERHAQEAAYWAGEQQARLNEEARLKSDLAQIKNENTSLRTRFNSIKVLPPHGNVPALPEIKQTLVQAGLDGSLVISEDVKISELSPSDAQKIWVWEEESARVPSLEEKVAAANEMMDGLARESAQKDKIIETTDEAVKSGTKEKQALELEIKSLQKRETASKWKTFFKILGAGVVGYYAGQHLNR
jgi:hypothetical protein